MKSILFNASLHGGGARARGSKGGAVVRAFASHQCGPRSNPGVDTICGLSLFFVVGSLLCSERFFFGYSGFPLSSKTNISKFQFDQESGRRRTTMWMCYLQIVIYLFYLFIWSQFYLIRGFTYLLHVCAGFTSEALFIIILIIGFTQ